MPSTRSRCAASTQLTTIDRDPETTRTALREFQKLLEKYPNSIYEEPAVKNIAICRDRLAEYELYVGRFYHRKGAYQSAVATTGKTAQGLSGLFCRKGSALLQRPVLHGTGEKAEARSAFETLARKYPSMTSEAKSHLT